MYQHKTVNITVYHATNNWCYIVLAEVQQQTTILYTMTKNFQILNTNFIIFEIFISDTYCKSCH